MSLRIGYVGLGAMGSHMANNLGRHAKSNSLPPLTIYNRSSSKYANVKKDNPDAHYAESAKEVSTRSDVVFTCLINDQAAEEVYTSLAKGLKGRQGKGEEKVIFVDQSSLKPTTSAKLEILIREAGGIYLASPIFGQPPMAEAAKLLIVISGEEKAREIVRPLLVPVLGNRLVDVGEDVKKATTLKLMGNAVLLGWVQLMGEVYALGDSIDFDPSLFNHFMELFVPAPPLLNYSNKVSKGLFPSGQGFAIDGGLKDARNMLSLGEDLGHPVALPTIELAKSNLERAKVIGGPDRDWSALAAAVREQVGLEPFRPGTNNGQGSQT